MSVAYAQDKVDSLWQVNKEAETPIAKVNSLLAVSTELLFTNVDSGRVVAKTALEMAKRYDFKDKVGKSYILIGRSYAWKASFDTASIYYEKAITQFNEINDLKGLSEVYINYGGVFYDQGDFVKTIDYWERSLKIVESIKDSSAIAVNLNNIGEVYEHMRDYEKAEVYFRRTLEIDSLIGDKKGIAYANLNIGYLALRNNQLDAAESRFIISNQLFTELRMLRPMASSAAAMGDVYMAKGDAKGALKFYSESQKIWNSSADNWGITEIKVQLARAHYLDNRLDSAQYYAEQGYQQAQKIKAKTLIVQSTNLLADIYERQGRVKDAFHYLKLYTQFQDSIFNRDNKDEIARLGVRYEFEKKSYLDSLKTAQNQKVQKLEHQQEIADKERTLQFGVIILIGMILLFVFIFRAYRIRTKTAKIIEEQKNKVEEQNELLEEKNRDILDSIMYAERIQSTILPHINRIKNHFADAFVIFKPKDIIGGDLYWFHEDESHAYISVIDCTGHGVPGALVGMVAYNALNHVVKDLGITETNEVLDTLTKIIEEEFTKDGQTAKDGMDMSFAKINLKINELQFSGAMNNLLICRDNDFIELKADRQPVGYFAKRSPFKSQTFHLNTNDQLFMLSDGYVDQFGGDRGKKLKITQFKNKLLEYQSLGFNEIQSNLESFFNEWKGNLEQIDDICIIGVKI
ncbi:tetratricopeptide repeat protein [Paracrocinitomix mangrovi]|uniref:tetratricopeptide repeat protein n=1 Tax=Paracrocinitomix mangrovi TaxID=2862509 RepID=UPI001C8F098C|nr:tetratricopeptide repeat protein [Paracrocinitomix mangrovi]UKN02577.1 tetratricopeptide repeat protein [Paracrocinitomix mangrovi]